jgi:hypothetical protein
MFLILWMFQGYTASQGSSRSAPSVGIRPAEQNGQPSRPSALSLLKPQGAMFENHEIYSRRC